MMLYTEHKILISNDTIKSSPGSTRPKSINSGQNTKNLIINAIQEYTTNEMKSFFEPPFPTVFNAYFSEPSISSIFSLA